MFKYVKFTKAETEYSVLEFRGGNEAVKVHHFDVDVVSVEAAVESDIDALVASQPAEIGCGFITHDEFVAIVKTTAQYARVKEIVEQKYVQDVSALITQYPQVERETWATQLAQAKAFKVSANELDAPFLKTLADAENGTIDDFANAVIVKAEAYATFMAQMLTNKRAHEKGLLAEFGV